MRHRHLIHHIQKHHSTNLQDMFDQVDAFLSLFFSRFSGFSVQFLAERVVEQHMWHGRGSPSRPIGLHLIGYFGG